MAERGEEFTPEGDPAYDSPVMVERELGKRGRKKADAIDVAQAEAALGA